MEEGGLGITSHNTLGAGRYTPSNDVMMWPRRAPRWTIPHTDMEDRQEALREGVATCSMPPVLSGKNEWIRSQGEHGALASVQVFRYNIYDLGIHLTERPETSDPSSWCSIDKSSNQLAWRTLL